MRSFVRQLRPALLMLIAFTVVTGFVYPLAVTGIGQSVFHHKANGSLVERNGEVVGSALIGQQFSDVKYFWPRPSAAGAGYDPTASSGSNLGPTNADFLTTVAERVAQYRKDNGLDDTVLVPVDAVTASASGLDPQISLANATLQAPRVATARGLTVDQVLVLVHDSIEKRPLGFLGDEGVNVLRLNIALDDADK
jgi:K+-transporting ATPase ATPase C chain